MYLYQLAMWLLTQAEKIVVELCNANSEYLLLNRALHNIREARSNLEDDLKVKGGTP